jgi:hypothetical protein
MNIIDLSEIALDTPAANENANLKKVTR